MVGVPLGIRDVARFRASAFPIHVENLFFEKNPINQVEEVALIERPPLIEILDVGPGPGRRVFKQAGFADNDLFHVSGDELWRHHRNSNFTITSTQIPGFVDGDGTPDMAATYEYLWITDGFDLQYTNGSAALTPITTPDFKPMISLDVFNSYVMCVQNDSDRFYWIEPGEVSIDPLNFATAERTPDHVLQVRTVGDTFWLLGEKTTEVWRATGVIEAPFMRIEGRLFDRGIVGGTAIRVKDSVIAIGDDGMTYDVQGGPEPISDPSIAERTRNAIRTFIDLGL